MYTNKSEKLIVIVGPQGSGKSTIANQIAESRGGYKTIQAEEFDVTSVSRLMRGEPNTVIVDGLSAKYDAALFEETAVFHRMYENSKTMKTPNYIFCILLEDFTKFIAKFKEVKHFQVILLGADNVVND